MPTVIADCALGVVSGQILGQPWTNVIGLKMPSNTLISQAVVNDVASRIRAAYASVAASLATNWSLDAFVLQDLRTANSPSWDGVITPFSGTDVAHPMPSNIAVVGSHRTGFRGKSYNGRTYLCGLTETANSTFGKVATAYITQFEGMFAAMRTNLGLVSGGPWQQAVVSRKLLVATPVVSTSIDEDWDHQDRRK